MHILKHPSKALVAALAIILLGVAVGIVLLFGISHGRAYTPLQKLQHDGYSQAPGVADNSVSDIGINGSGQGEFVIQGCQAQGAFESAAQNQGVASTITVSCSQGYLVIDAPNIQDLVVFASKLGV